MMIVLTGPGFWSVFLTSSIHDNYSLICFLDCAKNVFGKTPEGPNPNFNSSLSDTENEENLGKDIAMCYLNPLCFKLEDPQDDTK
jgi:hypothetical protein